MKRHQNRSGNKRRWLQAVFHKFYLKRYIRRYRPIWNLTQGLANALGTAALIGTVTLGWAKDDNSSPATLPEVVVTGSQDNEKNSYTSENISLTKYTQPLVDTPQSITVVSRQLMDDQGVTTMRDAVRNVPGISIAAGEAGAQGDNLTLRGFSARNDIYLDGMNDFGSYYRDAFDYEKVEVLEGPSGIDFGRGSTGGVINQVSKTPENYREISGTVGYGTDERNRETVDINEPIPQLGPGAAMRFNAMNEESAVSDRDIAENRHFGFAPSLALGLGTPTRITLSYLHEQENDNPDYGIPWLFNGPAPVSQSNYYGFKNGNFLDTVADIVTAKVEHDINDNITVDDQLRYGYYTRNVLITEAQIPAGVTLSTPLSSIMVNRNEINANSNESFLQNQFDITSKFNTGFLEHTLVTGVETGRETSDPTRRTYSGVPTTSLLDPNYDQSLTYTADPITSVVKTTVDDFGVYGLDTIKLNEHWDLMGGLRWDQYDSQYKQEVAPVAAFSRTDKLNSYRGAIVYKPVDIGSIYFDYGTSFDPSAESLSLSSSTANLPPESSETYEIGTKWDLLNKKMSLRSSIFRTEMNNTREPDPNNPLLNVLAGEQLVQGVEFEGAGHLTDKWQVDAGYAFLKSREEKSNEYPAAIGAELANVPANTFNFWTTYDLPWKLTVGGGGNFVDERTASSTVPIDPATGLVKEAPSYWAFNAMVEYHLNKNVDIQLNVYNLANKYYIDQIHPGHLVPGEGRTAIITTKFKF